MIPIAKPLIGEEEKNAVMKVLDSGILASAGKVLEFERLFAEYVGRKYAVAVNSGTAALQVALMAHGIGTRIGTDIGYGDEVITSPFTFIATANSILSVGAKPVFADIEEDTFNIDPESIVDKITDKTVAILPVHLYGLGADMKSITEIAEDYRLIVIEDACQAIGAKIDGKMVGGCFSFYPTKNMTTGEGGMIVTNDYSIYDKCQLIRSHGARKETRYIHQILGYNFRMTDISAAIGIEQLKKIDNFNRIRQENARYMSSRLNSDMNGNNSGIITPIVRDGYEHVFNQYTIRVLDSQRERDYLVRLLRSKGVGAEVYYPIAIHRQPLYRKLGYNDYLKNAEKMSNEVISLPIHPGITNNDIDYIVDVIKGGI